MKITESDGLLLIQIQISSTKPTEEPISQPKLTHGAALRIKAGEQYLSS